MKNVFCETRNSDSGIHSVSESFSSKDIPNSQDRFVSFTPMTDEEKREQEMKHQMQDCLNKFSTEKDKCSFLYKPNQDGDTKLHQALIHGYPNLSLEIIDYASSPSLLNQRNNDGLTALHLSVYQKYPKVIRKLLIRGADQSLTDGNGNIALHLCCKKAYNSCIQELISPLSREEKNMKCLSQKEVSLNQIARIRNFDGLTCLHEAVLHDRLDVVEILLQYDAFKNTINSPDYKSGRTIVHYAVESLSKEFNEKLLKFILSHGRNVDLEATTFSGYSPMEIASGLKNQKAVRILEEYKDEGFGTIQETFHNLKF